jgi:hypothetical protein
MLMTGADERGVQAIEKLTKQKFEPATIDVERARPERSRYGDRPERGERGERRDRDDRPRRGERTERDATRTYQPAAPVDDFFLKPYQPVEESTGAEGAGTAPATPAPTTVRPESRPRVAALLGGGKR